MTTILQIAGQGLGYDGAEGQLYVRGQAWLAGASTGGGPTALGGMPVMAPSAGMFRLSGFVNAQSASTGDGISWDVQAFVVRNAPGQAARMVGGPSVSVFAADDSLAGFGGALTLVDGFNGPEATLVGPGGDTLVAQGLLVVTGAGLVVPEPIAQPIEGVLVDDAGHAVFDAFTQELIFAGGAAGDEDLVNSGVVLPQVDLSPASRADIIQAMQRLWPELLTQLAGYLPDALPADAGMLWNNNGVVSVS